MANALSKKFMYEGKLYSYSMIHYYVHKWWGKADHCDIDSSHPSRRYEWSNISHQYSLDRHDWRQLCKSCHLKADITLAGRKSHSDKMKLLNISDQFTPGKHLNKEIQQYSMTGKLINTYPSATIAAKTLGTSKYVISAAATGKTKSSGGYIWSYTNKVS